MQPRTVDLLDVDPLSLVDDEEPFPPTRTTAPRPKPKHPPKSAYRTARSLMSAH